MVYKYIKIMLCTLKYLLLVWYLKTITQIELIKKHTCLIFWCKHFLYSVFSKYTELPIYIVF